MDAMNSTQIEDMAAQYVADLRAVQPHGPYHLGGYCFGGNVAFEMARQLEADGEEVALLALLNCSPPNGHYARIKLTPAWMWSFARNLLYWAGYCRQWTPAQRRNFIRWKKELWKKRLGRLFGRSSENAGKMDAGNLVDISSYSPEERRLWEKHIHALTQYRPGRFGGRVHLFRSPGHPLLCSFEDDYGWGELASGGVCIEVVPGVHEKILEEPCVRAVAEKLRPVVNAIAHESIEDSQVQNEIIQNRATTNMVDNGDLSAVNTEAPRFNGWHEPELDCEYREDLAYQLSEWNDTATDFPLDQTYARHFERQAARTPDAVALQFQGERWTYADLNARANRLAHHFKALGVGPEVLVAVCLERSLELPAALLAVLKAGGAYLPLDRSYPRERLSFMLSDSRPSVLLTRAEFLPDFGLKGKQGNGAGNSFSPENIVCLNDPRCAQQIQNCPSSNPDSAATPDSLAYVIYTSGSTGAPKGVEITQRSMVNHNFATADAYELGPQDRVLQFSPFSFDISVEEIFPPWLRGAAVVMRTDDDLSSAERFLQMVRNESLSVLNVPTAYWHELVECVRAGEVPPSLRLVIIGGEKASDEAWRRWKDRAGSGVALINAYGPTETTVTATLHRAQPEDETLPIGKPLANVQAVILDGDLKPVPVGSTGELYIGGTGVARGYLNRPELTAQKFIGNPLKEISSPRLYKTGDMARFRPDGTIEFAGRVDEQVKIRGYRIELGEIETVLASHPDLKETIVVAREDRPGQKRLVAYYVPRQATAPRVSDLLKFLKERLPNYMAPAAFVEMQSLPLTPAGKVDRAALPEPGHERPELDQEFVAPRTPVEEVIAGIWAEVLGYNRVGVQDNFFDLGGHSLLATQVISRMREALQVEIPLAHLFEFPTVAALAERLAEAGGQAQPVLPGIRCEQGRAPPVDAGTTPPLVPGSVRAAAIVLQHSNGIAVAWPAQHHRDGKEPDGAHAPSRSAARNFSRGGWSAGSIDMRTAGHQAAGHRSL